MFPANFSYSRFTIELNVLRLLCSAKDAFSVKLCISNSVSYVFLNSITWLTCILSEKKKGKRGRIWGHGDLPLLSLLWTLTHCSSYCLSRRGQRHQCWMPEELSSEGSFVEVNYALPQGHLPFDDGQKVPWNKPHVFEFFVF